MVMVLVIVRPPFGLILDSSQRATGTLGVEERLKNSGALTAASSGTDAWRFIVEEEEDEEMQIEIPRSWRRGQVLLAEVVVLLVRPAVASIDLAAVASAMGPAKPSRCRHLGAPRCIADVSSAVGPAVAISLGLARAARDLAELAAAVVEAPVVQPRAVRAVRVRAPRASLPSIHSSTRQLVHII